MRQAEQLFQAQLLVDRIRPVQRAAVRPLHAAHAGAEILPQRVTLQMAEIVQTHVRGDLKFQRHAVIPHILQQLFPARAAQIAGIQTVPDAHRRESLAGLQRFRHASDAVGDIVAQAVVLARVDADHETGLLSRQSDDLAYHAAQFEDIVDLLADDIAAGDIRVGGDHAQAAQVFRQIVVGRDPVAHDRQRDAADAGEKAQKDSRLARDAGHDLVDLPQSRGEFSAVEEGRVGDLGVFDAVFSVFPRDPQQQILIERVGTVARVLAVAAHLPGVGADLPVRDALDIDAGERLVRALPFCKNIAVEVDLFEIGKHRLAVLRDREGIAHPFDVVGRVLRIAEDQFGEVDEGKVVDPPLPVLAGQRDVAESVFRLAALLLQARALPFRTAQRKLFDVIIGVADLVHDTERDQRVRRQDAVHVRVQVRPEFAVGSNIGLDDRLFHAEAVIFRLTHQGFGDRGDRGLQFDPAVGIDVGDLGVAQAQDIHAAVVAVHVTGDLVADDRRAVLVDAGLQAAERGKIGDQIPRAVVRGPDHVKKPLAFQKELDGDILFPVKIKLLKKDHALLPSLPNGENFLLNIIVAFPALVVNPKRSKRLRSLPLRALLRNFFRFAQKTLRVLRSAVHRLCFHQRKNTGQKSGVFRWWR